MHFKIALPIVLKEEAPLTDYNIQCKNAFDAYGDDLMARLEKGVVESYRDSSYGKALTWMRREGIVRQVAYNAENDKVTFALITPPDPED